MRRHELDPVSLVFGFAFTVAGALFLAGRVDQAVRLRWLWPLLLLALGLGILLDLGTRRSRTPADAAEAAVSERVEAERPGEPAPRPAEEASRTAEVDPEDPRPERDR